MKNYQKFKNIIFKNNVSEEEIKKSNSYISLLNFFDKELIFIANFQSFCSKKNPSRIRLRKDSFLKIAKEKKEAILISSYSYLDKKKLFIFKSSFFFNYQKSTNSSNSIITFDFEQEFKFFYINDNVGKVLKKSKKDHKIVNSSFYISDLNDLDLETFKEFKKSNDLLQKIIKNENIDPSIPIKFREIMWNNYNEEYRCSNYITNKNKCRCYITDPRKEDCNIHHFIPREYFKEKIDINWGNIHSPINLIPICYYCHKDIHSNLNFENIFWNIVEVYKKHKLYEKFIKFMKDFTDLKDINDLFLFYKKN